MLTHWGRVTHICISKFTIIGSDNGLSPGQCQAIIWTNAEILLIEHLGTNFSEIVIEICTFSFKKMHLKMPSGKWRPFCLSLNVLINMEGLLWVQSLTNAIALRFHLCVWYVIHGHNVYSVWHLLLVIKISNQCTLKHEISYLIHYYHKGVYNHTNYSYIACVVSKLSLDIHHVSPNSLGLMLFVCNWCNKKLSLSDLILSYLILPYWPIS